MPAVMVALVLVVFLALGSADGVIVQGLSDAVTDARAELAAAEAVQGEVEGNLAETRERYAAVKWQLDQLSVQNRTTLNQLETVQSRAERLAVAAYVRGAGAEDLQTLDVQRATDAAWRRVFTEGRVDQALEAAAQLKSLRSETDDGLQALAMQVTALGRVIDDIDHIHREELVGHGEIEADELQGLGAVDGGPQMIRMNFKREIAPVQTQRGESGVLHRWRGGMLDGMPIDRAITRGG